MVLEELFNQRKEKQEIFDNITEFASKIFKKILH
jgi:hypothetical protein